MNTPTSLHAQCLKGAEYLAAKDYQNAASMFNDVLKADRDNMEANAGVAALLHETGNERAALPYLQKAVQSAPRNVSLLCLAITIVTKLGMFDELKHYATKAYKIAPKSVHGIKAYLLYLQHAGMGSAREIERLAPALLALDSGAESRHIAGTALEMIGKIPEAIRIYRNGIRDVLAAKSPPPPRAQGCVLSREGSKRFI